MLAQRRETRQRAAVSAASTWGTKVYYVEVYLAATTSNVFQSIKSGWVVGGGLARKTPNSVPGADIGVASQISVSARSDWSNNCHGHRPPALHGGPRGHPAELHGGNHHLATAATPTLPWAQNTAMAATTTSPSANSFMIIEVESTLQGGRTCC